VTYYEAKHMKSKRNSEEPTISLSPMVVQFVPFIPETIGLQIRPLNNGLGKFIESSITRPCTARGLVEIW